MNILLTLHILLTCHIKNGKLAPVHTTKAYKESSHIVSYSRHYMKVSDQLQTAAALPPPRGEATTVLAEYEA